MKKILWLLLLIGGMVPAWSQPGRSNEGTVAAFLDSIRSEEARLTAFFSMMPKGGDLHHHFTGSIYAETYLKGIEENDYWINLRDWRVSPTKPKRKRKNWERISDLQKEGRYREVREELLERWSVQDYEFHQRIPPDEQFFGAFPAFAPAVLPVVEEGLTNIKERAIKENVSYIETMFTGVLCRGVPFSYPESADKLMHFIQERKDQSGLFSLLDILFSDLEENGLKACAENYNRWVRELHESLDMESEQFVMRYQNYVLRNKTPTEVFSDLTLNFESAARNPLIVGVNIVAPEHHPVAVRDYWLHMQMYQYLSRKYLNVRKALHAGELTLGQVPPEELTWHIRGAVAIAGAGRIGHGVDLPYETGWPQLLDTMRRERVAVEINLSSNAFILDVRDDEHPLSFYFRAGVPIVISTDDAGVLRGNLTEQYVRLVSDYPFIGYSDVKKFVYNSIEYSFLEDLSLKRSIKEQLEKRFAAFEERIVGWMRDGY